MSLRRSDPASPGITRRRRGRGYSYHGPDGKPVTDPDEIRRVKELAVPPGWHDVWICPSSEGHIQACGTDDAGRRLAERLSHERFAQPVVLALPRGGVPVARAARARRPVPVRAGPRLIFR